jgi:hypothetical protein
VIYRSCRHDAVVYVRALNVSCVPCGATSFDVGLASDPMTGAMYVYTYKMVDGMNRPADLSFFT